MPWPKYEYVTTNVSIEILPFVKRALDGDMIKWVQHFAGDESRAGIFEWAGCRWGISGTNEMVDFLYLIAGEINLEVLTFALIKGKIETR